MRRPALIAFALLSGCFALAVTVEPALATTRPYLRHEHTPVEVILGDARRFFATHFFVKADVYFHSGYYPSVFDDTSEHHDTHIATDADAVAAHHDENEDHDFLGKPLDLIDQFSRSFYPSTHTHLDEDHGNALDEGKDKIREMLPWLRMTAAMDQKKQKRLSHRRRRRQENKPERQQAKKLIAGELHKMVVPSTNVRELLRQISHESLPYHLTI